MTLTHHSTPSAILFLLLARSHLAFTSASTQSASDPFIFPPALRERPLEYSLFNTDPWTSTFPTYSSTTSPEGPRITIDISPQRPFPPMNADSNLMPIDDSIFDGNTDGAGGSGSSSKDSMIAAVARRYRIQLNSGQNPVADDNRQEDFFSLLRNMASSVGADGLTGSSLTGALTTSASSSSQKPSSKTSTTPSTETCDDS